MIGRIYKVTNTINGIAYIGQTMSSIAHRWRTHLYAKSSCKRLKNAIDKYGVENFKIEELTATERDDKTSLLNALNELEIQAIEDHGTLNPLGYNMIPGGRNAYKPSSKIRRRGWKRTPESIAKYIKTKTGMKYGPKTPEQVRKTADAAFKPVICVETGQTWPSVKGCAAYFGVKPKQISRILKGQRKRLKWQFTIQYLKQSY